MDPFAKPTTNKSNSGASINPFAKALAETEHAFNNQQQTQAPAMNPFSEALARTGGRSVSDFGQNSPFSPEDYQQQLAEQQRQQKKEALRKKLHDQVNPVDLVDVFSAREKRVKEELEKTRQDLQALAKEITKFYKSVDIATFEEVVEPGTQGTYYISFFQKLRNFIMLLRQHVRSATTWANQMQSKSKKKKRKGAAGMIIGGAAHEKTTTVQDMMHHERSNAFSGG